LIVARRNLLVVVDEQEDKKMCATKWQLAVLGIGLLAAPAWAGEGRSESGKNKKSSTANTRELRPLFKAIRTVETGGKPSARDAVGDGGRSIGPYQISRAYWADSGVNGEWRRCKTHSSAEAAMLAYWKRYCPDALRRGDFETLARVHNGGPSGHRKAATAGYWDRVESELKALTTSGA
jgi:hypothetical protein